MRMRLVSLTCALLWAATASAASATSSSEEARALIKRMSLALVNENYAGELTHRWNGGGETLRIIHRMRDGKMVERVTSLSSAGVEIIRDGTQFIKIFPAKPGARRIAVVETRTRSYGFISALNGVSAASDKYYVITNGGPQPLLGWPTPMQLVTVEPRDAYRYGYRLWLDPHSSLPIKTQLITKSGEVIDEIAFSNLRLMKSIPDEWLKPADELRWMKYPGQEPVPVKQAFVPRQDLLPDGFRVLPIQQPADGEPAGPQTRFIVSDGVSWVSVVIAVAGPSPEGFAEGFGPTMAAQQAYMLRRDNHYISVMGEVPRPVVKAVAEAVRPE